MVECEVTPDKCEATLAGFPIEIVPKLVVGLLLGVVAVVRVVMMAPVDNVGAGGCWGRGGG